MNIPSYLISHCYCLLALLSFCSLNPLFSQHYDWVQMPGGSGSFQINDLITDSAGHTYITGEFQDTVYFDMNPSPCQAVSEGYVARYDQSGNLDWVVTIPGTQSSAIGGERLAFGPDGILYVSGSSIGSGTLDTLTLNGVSGRDAWLARLDTAGNAYWTRMFHTYFGSANTLGIAADDSGNVAIAGNYTGILVFPDSSQYTEPRYSATFIAKLDSSGKLKWTLKGYSNVGGLIPEAMGIDSSGNLYLAGQTDKDSRMGGLRRTDEGNFVARISPAGYPDWYSVFPTSQLSLPATQRMDVDAAGNIYLLGGFVSTIRIGNQVYSSTGIRNLYLAKIASGGQILWSQKIEGDVDEYPHSLELIGDSLLAWSGAFSNSVLDGPFQLQASGLSHLDLFLAVSDVDGNPIWVKHLPDASGVIFRGHDMGHDAAGNLYFCGRVNHQDSLWFDHISLVRKGTINGFFGKVLDIPGTVHVEEAVHDFPELLIYPNPVSDVMIVSGVSEQQGMLEIELLDQTGKIIRQWKWHLDKGGFQKVLSSGNLAKGVYLVRVRKGSQQAIQKLVRL